MPTQPVIDRGCQSAFGRLLSVATGEKTTQSSPSHEAENGQKIFIQIWLELESKVLSR
jgi:hypothetical protein